MSCSKKTVVVTGATSGIGFAAADLLAGQGMRVFLVGHAMDRCKAARQKLLASHPDADIACFAGDLVHQREVLRVAAEIREKLARDYSGELFGLVNNAGCVRSWYMTSDEGYEQQFALNHLAGFLMALELLPELKKAAGRVLFTASQSHRFIKMRWNDLMLQRGYNPLLAYKQSKLCNLLTAHEFNRRFGGSGVTFQCVDPGLVNTGIGCKDTGYLVNSIWSARRKKGREPEVPARTYLYLLGNERREGLYFGDCAAKRYSREVNDKNAQRLYEISAKLCGVGGVGAEESV
ncbi:MAG TPA: SDR family NAD(P)-dependent oxidoreductase [Clostridia bacterium]|nr:SDR family NAD(P)-dependent oxidoreductase [Clostridia bacterium]